MGPERTIETYVRRTCLHFACQNPQTTKAAFFVYIRSLSGVLHGIWKVTLHCVTCLVGRSIPPGDRPTTTPTFLPSNPNALCYASLELQFCLLFLIPLQLRKCSLALFWFFCFFFFCQLTLSAPKACSLFWALCASVSDRKRWGSLALPDFRSSFSINEDLVSS